MVIYFLSIVFLKFFNLFFDINLQIRKNNIKYKYINKCKGLIFLYTLISNSSIETMNIAKCFASKLHNGDTIILTGDLGSRKN